MSIRRFKQTAGSGRIISCTTMFLLLAGSTVPSSAADLPAFAVQSSSQVIDTMTKWGFSFDQPDQKGPLIRDYGLSIPSGWRFSFASLRNSTLQSCADVASPFAPPYVGVNTIARDNMEAIGYARIVLATDDTRDPQPRITAENATNPGQWNPGPAVYDGGGPLHERPAAGLWFLDHNSDTQTSRLCGVVKTDNTRIPQHLREIIFEIRMRLLTDGSWDMRFDLEAVPGEAPGFKSVTDNQDFRNANVSILSLALDLTERSGGNFNTDSGGESCRDGSSVPAGAECRIVLTQTPILPGDYLFSATLRMCPRTETSCPDPNISRQDSLRITPLPSTYVHDFATLTGPTTPGIPLGYAIVEGNSETTVSWKQPAPNPVEAVRGYVLAIASPGEQDTLNFDYIVTDPTADDFDHRHPCGSDGSSEECNISLSFPMGAGRSLLEGDGRYDIALVTIYRDGHRTDGRCDDGTGRGADCGPTLGGFRVKDSGISKIQLFITPRAWPNVFVETQYYFPSGASAARFFEAPAYVLFVDFELRRAEFVVWHVHSGPPERYYAASNSILGAEDAGIISFGNASIGNGLRFTFQGYAMPGTQSGCRGPTGILAQGCGVFILYDLRGAPSSPPNGLPILQVEPFEGVRV